MVRIIGRIENAFIHLRNLNSERDGYKFHKLETKLMDGWMDGWMMKNNK